MVPQWRCERGRQGDAGGVEDAERTGEEGDAGGPLDVAHSLIVRCTFHRRVHRNTVWLDDHPCVAPLHDLKSGLDVHLGRGHRMSLLTARLGANWI